MSNASFISSSTFLTIYRISYLGRIRQHFQLLIILIHQQL